MSAGSVPGRTREVRLASRPRGLPTETDFEVAEATLDPPAEGEVLLRTIWLSVDQYMRGRMNDTRSYAPPFALGEAMAGGGVGEVVESRHPGLSPGDVVTGRVRWREHDVVTAGAAGHLERVDPSAAPLPAHLGVLGMPGMTAYVGLLDIGRLQAGETVFVSGAAGAVGSAAGQIAKIKGATVIGSAGGQAKTARLRELRFDHAIDYKAARSEPGGLSRALAEAAPDGVDVYFDNVGGEHLRAALSAMNDFGRIVMCGAISQYNATEPTPGPPNLALAVGRRLTLQGFLVGDHAERRPAFVADMTRWVAEGRVSYDQTVVDGLEQAPSALIGLFGGANTGKMLVRVGADHA
ncbi:MAG: NADP-dependent oxidoreductase [Acidimicrobiales bacterium]